jgi:hypothetical protein
MDPELQRRHFIDQELQRGMYRCWTACISLDSSETSDIVYFGSPLRPGKFIHSQHHCVLRKCPCNMMHRVTTSHTTISRDSVQAHTLTMCLAYSVEYVRDFIA